MLEAIPRSAPWCRIPKVMGVWGPGLHSGHAVQHLTCSQSHWYPGNTCYIPHYRSQSFSGRPCMSVQSRASLQMEQYLPFILYSDILLQVSKK